MTAIQSRNDAFSDDVPLQFADTQHLVLAIRGLPLTKSLQQMIETTIKTEARFVAFTQIRGVGDSGGDPGCLCSESANCRLHYAGMGHLNAIKQESGYCGERSQVSGGIERALAGLRRAKREPGAN